MVHFRTVVVVQYSGRFSTNITGLAITPIFWVAVYTIFIQNKLLFYKNIFIQPKFGKFMFF
jgi:hypothetical protein